MSDQRGPDPVANSDQFRGTTPPESGAEGSNVAGRPAVEPTPRAFHQASETPDRQKRPLNPEAAVAEGGSFDGVVPTGKPPEK